MKPLALLLLLLAANACAETITKDFAASASFDENGRSVDAVLPGLHVVENQFANRQSIQIMPPVKEPAVVWCHDLIYLSTITVAWLPDTYVYGGGDVLGFKSQEICGREDGSVFWQERGK